MAIAAYSKAIPVAGRPRRAPRRSTEPEAILAALMLVMLLIGFTAVVLARQADRPRAAPRARPIEGWVGRTSDAQAVGSSASSAPAPTIVPSVPPPAPSASQSEPVPAGPAFAVNGQAQVANTAGRGVILHAEPRRGARTPSGLLEGARVTLLELAGEEWARVRSAQGRVGWVPTAYLVPTD